MKTVNADTLAAALRTIHGDIVPLPNRATVEEYAAIIIEWLPPDPRLDALLAAVKHHIGLSPSQDFVRQHERLRDALAAFDHESDEMEALPFFFNTPEP